MSTQGERKIHWSPIIVEAGMIVLGILLGLAANEWRQHLEEVNRAEHALSTIHDELVKNYAMVTDASSYHHSLMDTLNKIEEAGTGRPNLLLFNRGYVAGILIGNTAWEMAKQTNSINNMDYELVLELVTQVSGVKKGKKRSV